MVIFMAVTDPGSFNNSVAGQQVGIICGSCFMSSLIYPNLEKYISIFSLFYKIVQFRVLFGIIVNAYFRFDRFSH